MTFELAYSNEPQKQELSGVSIEQRAFVDSFAGLRVTPFDADNREAEWPLPPVKRWNPGSGFDLDAMCEEALARLGEELDWQVERNKLEMWASKIGATISPAGFLHFHHDN